MLPANKAVSLTVALSVTHKDGRMTEQTPESLLATYHERRELSVVQPTGSLALTNTQWIDSVSYTHLTLPTILLV